MHFYDNRSTTAWSALLVGDDAASVLEAAFNICYMNATGLTSNDKCPAERKVVSFLHCIRSDALELL